MSNDQASFEAFLQQQVVPLQGRFKEVGIYLTPPAGSDLVPGASLLDPATLTAEITRFGAQIGTTNLRIAGVHWVGQLGYAILPPIELAMSRAGIGLNAALTNLSLVYTAGKPTALVLNDLSDTVVLPERYHGPVPLTAVGRSVGTAEELRTFVLDHLFGQTFLPLIERIHALTQVSRQVLWGQVAYEADLFFQQLVRVEPAAQTTAWENDHAAFFARKTWPVASGGNPLCHPTKTITIAGADGPTTRTVRSICCLIYHVPGSKMCGACPLAPKKERVYAKQASAVERRRELQELQSGE